MERAKWLVQVLTSPFCSTTVFPGIPAPIRVLLLNAPNTAKAAVGFPQLSQKEEARKPSLSHSAP